jgi:hypothetical protein
MHLWFNWPLEAYCFPNLYGDISKGRNVREHIVRSLMRRRNEEQQQEEERNAGGGARGRGGGAAAGETGRREEAVVGLHYDEDDNGIGAEDVVRIAESTKKVSAREGHNRGRWSVPLHDGQSAADLTNDQHLLEAQPDSDPRHHNEGNAKAVASLGTMVNKFVADQRPHVSASMEVMNASRANVMSIDPLSRESSSNFQAADLQSLSAVSQLRMRVLMTPNDLTSTSLMK